jgi:hypothetical protein
MAKEQNGAEQDFEQELPDNLATDIAKVISEGDPDMMLAVMERKAANAKKYAELINTILITQTYPEDWKEFSGKMCLSSAGAERIARMFSIKYFDVVAKKEEFADANGKGYRYIYEGKAEMNGRIIFVMGVYSTRDKFLGFAKNEWKDIVDINENDIRTAAYHRFCGNAVKSLLGLRGMPTERFDTIFKTAGDNPAGKTTAVNYASGTKGGTSGDDVAMQKELGQLLIDIANACYGITIDEKGQYDFEQMSEVSDSIEVAKASCKALTSFYSKKDSKIVAGIDSVKLVKGQRLEIALNNAKKLWAAFQQQNGGGQ